MSLHNLRHRSLWEYLPLKQGLRLQRSSPLSEVVSLWEYLPLKQGLRLMLSCPSQFPPWSLRVSSIKTRIKTDPSSRISQFKVTLRVSSIKTRIKTNQNYNYHTMHALRVSSIKTRIKTKIFFYQQINLISLRVSSIKTRIKTLDLFHYILFCNLWEYLPLKQGLRRRTCLREVGCCLTLRVSSIKTRIKTLR